MREGMGEAPEPSGAVGRIGYWCWETMTPLVAGSYRAACTAVGVLVLLGGRSALSHVDDHDPAEHSPAEAEAITVGDD